MVNVATDTLSRSPIHPLNLIRERLLFLKCLLIRRTAKQYPNTNESVISL